MAAALVQSASNTSFDTTSVTVSFSAATAGNLLVAFWGTRGSPFSQSTTVTSGWSVAVPSFANNSNANSPQLTIYYKVAAGGETSVTMTDTTQTSGTMNAVVQEWSGVRATSPFDASATGDSGATTVTSLASGTTATLAQADELCFAAWSVRSVQSSASFTNSFTQEALVTNNGNASLPSSLIVASKTVTGTTAVSSTATWDVSARSVGAVVTFKVIPPIDFVKHVGSSTNKNASTSSSVTVPASGCAAGNLLIVRFGANAPMNTVTCTDTQGNTYTQLHLSANDPDVVLFASRLTTALVSGNTITTSYSSTDRAGMAVDEFSGASVTEIATSSAGGPGPSSTPSSGASGTPSADRGLAIGFLYTNGPSGDSFTEDADTTGGVAWTSLTRVGTTGASAASNVTVAGAWKLTSTAAAQTYNPTITSREYGAIVAVLGVQSTGNVEVTPSTVATTTTITTPTVGVGIEITKSPFATTTSLTTPSVGGGGGFVQGALSTTTVLPTATVTSGAGIDATLVSATTTLTTPTVAGGAAFSNSAVATTTALTTPSLGAGAGVSQSTLSATTTISTPSIAAGAAATPSTVSTTTALGEPTIGAGATFSSTTVDASTSFPSASLGGGAGFTQSTLTVTTTLNTPTITTTNNSPAEATPDTVAVTTTLTTPSVDGGAGVSQSTLSVTTTIATPTVAGSSNLTQTQLDVTTAIAEPQIDGGAGFSQATFEVSVTFPAPTVTVGAGVTPSTLVVTTSFDTPWVETPSEEEPYEMQPNRRRRGTRRPLRDRPAEP